MKIYNTIRFSDIMIKDLNEQEVNFLNDLYTYRTKSVSELVLKNFGGSENTAHSRGYHYMHVKPEFVEAREQIEKHLEQNPPTIRAKWTTIEDLEDNKEKLMKQR